MNLRDLPDGPISVVRDGAFQSVGFLSHRRPRMLSFVESAGGLDELASNPDVSAVITVEELVPRIPASLGVCVAPSPREALLRVHNHLASETSFYPAPEESRCDPAASVHRTAHVAARGVRIHAGVRVEPMAVIMEGTELQEGALVRAGAVVGSEGFQFEPTGGELLAVRHTGGVRVGRGAEIQSGAVVDRAVFGGATEIGAGSRLDSLVFVAHEARLGRRCRLVAHSVICGSAHLGDNVWVGPGAVVSSGCRVGDGARISLGAVVTRDVTAGQTVSGNFAIDHQAFLAHLKKLR